VELVMREQLKWNDEKSDNAPWIALAELRQPATALASAVRLARRATHRLGKARRL